MGDFFYYGQKDTIRRLNELAGRGAVVASYMPAVGRSPLGGPNGYMNPAWLDPNLPMYTDVPLAVKAVGKFGYTFVHSGQSQALFKIATMSPENAGFYGSLRIDAMLGGWIANSLTAMTIIMGTRGPFSVDWSTCAGIPAGVKFVVFVEADNSHSVYLMFNTGTFSQASFDLHGMGIATHATPTAVSSVSGTLVWDSGAVFGEAGFVSPRVTSSMVDGRNVGTSAKGALIVRSLSGDPLADSVLTGGSASNRFPATTFHELFRLGMTGVAGTSYSGYWAWNGSEGNGNPYYQGYRMRLNAHDGGSGNSSAALLSVSGDGQVYVPRLRAGTQSEVMPVNYHVINRGTAQGDEIVYVGLATNAAPSFAVLGSSGEASWNSSVSVLYAGKNSTTGRSMNVPGTINTMGNDYAEYIFKTEACGIVAPGQVVGITADNKVTDKWADAIMFSIKSTAPSFVGGDTWASDVGSRPSPQAGPAPVKPPRREDVVTQQAVPGTNPLEFEDAVAEPGDTDDEWAEKLAIYTAALAAHNIAVQQDVEAMAAFDAALEVERQKVDRIAIAGRVPVNVQGAQPGDYIVPVQDGAGIKGIAVHEDDLNIKLYLRAVGRVISIEPDGRAYVMVKVV